MVSEISPPFVISAFANAVIDQDYELAHSYLSKSLQQRLPIGELRHTLLEAEEDTVPPVNFAWRRTDMGYRDWIAGNDRASAPEIYPDNFVSWSCIAFDGDTESCYQLWCLLISENDQERIGFFEITDPD